MTLTPDQKDICDKRLEEHQHETYVVDIPLTGKVSLEHFYVMKGVFRPETTSGLYFAKYLSNNPEIYENKKVLDLGCGSGIQGVVAAMNGASSILFSDISELVIENSIFNMKRYGLLDKASFVCGDLFEKVYGTFDIILFNHPFFDNEPEPNQPITRAWFDEGGKTLNKFLDKADTYLNEEGRIIIPFFPFAGNTNDPWIQGKSKGYKITTIYKENVDDMNLQKGEFVIYSLKK